MFSTKEYNDALDYLRLNIEKVQYAGSNKTDGNFGGDASTGNSSTPSDSNSSGTTPPPKQPGETQQNNQGKPEEKLDENSSLKPQDNSEQPEQSQSQDDYQDPNANNSKPSKWLNGYEYQWNDRVGAYVHWVTINGQAIPFTYDEYNGIESGGQKFTPEQAANEFAAQGQQSNPQHTSSPTPPKDTNPDNPSSFIENTVADALDQNNADQQYSFPTVHEWSVENTSPTEFDTKVAQWVGNNLKTGVASYLERLADFKTRGELPLEQSKLTAKAAVRFEEFVKTVHSYHGGLNAVRELGIEGNTHAEIHKSIREKFQGYVNMSAEQLRSQAKQLNYEFDQFVTSTSDPWIEEAGKSLYDMGSTSTPESQPSVQPQPNPTPSNTENTESESPEQAPSNESSQPTPPVNDTYTDETTKAISKLLASSEKLNVANGKIDTMALAVRVALNDIGIYDCNARQSIFDYATRDSSVMGILEGIYEVLTNKERYPEHSKGYYYASLYLRNELTGRLRTLAQEWRLTQGEEQLFDFDDEGSFDRASYPGNNFDKGDAFDRAMSNAGITTAKISELSVDPKRFQYKDYGGSEFGDTKKLKDVETFSPFAAGTLLVWHDPEDEQHRNFVINGHHRFGLAQRLGYKGDLYVKFINAQNENEARALGALVNIMEGNGTVWDAAKFLKETNLSPEQSKKLGLNLSSDLFVQARSLINLPSAIWNEAVVADDKVQKAALTVGSLFDIRKGQFESNEEYEKRYQGNQDALALTWNKIKKLGCYGDIEKITVLSEMAKKAYTAVDESSEQGYLFDVGVDTQASNDKLNVYLDITASLLKNIKNKLSDASTFANSKKVARLNESGLGTVTAEQEKAIETRDMLKGIKDNFTAYITKDKEIEDLINKAVEDIFNAQNSGKQSSKNSIIKNAVDAITNLLTREGGRALPESKESELSGRDTGTDVHESGTSGSAEEVGTEPGLGQEPAGLIPSEAEEQQALDELKAEVENNSEPVSESQPSQAPEPVVDNQSTGTEEATPETPEEVVEETANEEEVTELSDNLKEEVDRNNPDNAPSVVDEAVSSVIDEGDTTTTNASESNSVPADESSNTETELTSQVPEEQAVEEPVSEPVEASSKANSEPVDYSSPDTASKAVDDVLDAVSETSLTPSPEETTTSTPQDLNSELESKASQQANEANIDFANKDDSSIDNNTIDNTIENKQNKQNSDLLDSSANQSNTPQEKSNEPSENVTPTINPVSDGDNAQKELDTQLANKQNADFANQQPDNTAEETALTEQQETATAVDNTAGELDSQLPNTAETSVNSSETVPSTENVDQELNKQLPKEPRKYTPIKRRGKATSKEVAEISKVMDGMFKNGGAKRYIKNGGATSYHTDAGAISRINADALLHGNDKEFYEIYRALFGDPGTKWYNLWFRYKGTPVAGAFKGIIRERARKRGNVEGAVANFINAVEDHADSVAHEQHRRKLEAAANLPTEIADTANEIEPKEFFGKYGEVGFRGTLTFPGFDTLAPFMRLLHSQYEVEDEWGNEEIASNFKNAFNAAIDYYREAGKSGFNSGSAQALYKTAQEQLKTFGKSLDDYRIKLAQEDFDRKTEELNKYKRLEVSKDVAGTTRGDLAQTLIDVVKSKRMEDIESWTADEYRSIRHIMQDDTPRGRKLVGLARKIEQAKSDNEAKNAFNEFIERDPYYARRDGLQLQQFSDGDFPVNTDDDGRSTDGTLNAVLRDMDIGWWGNGNKEAREELLARLSHDGDVRKLWVELKNAQNEVWYKVQKAREYERAWKTVDKSDEAVAARKAVGPAKSRVTTLGKKLVARIREIIAQGDSFTPSDDAPFNFNAVARAQNKQSSNETDSQDFENSQTVDDSLSSSDIDNVNQNLDRAMQNVGETDTQKVSETDAKAEEEQPKELSLEEKKAKFKSLSVSDEVTDPERRKLVETILGHIVGDLKKAWEEYTPSDDLNDFRVHSFNPSKTEIMVRILESARAIEQASTDLEAKQIFNRRLRNLISETGLTYGTLPIAEYTENDYPTDLNGTHERRGKYDWYIPLIRKHVEQIAYENGINSWVRSHEHMESAYPILASNKDIRQKWSDCETLHTKLDTIEAQLREQYSKSKKKEKETVQKAFNNAKGEMDKLIEKTLRSSDFASKVSLATPSSSPRPAGQSNPPTSEASPEEISTLGQELQNEVQEKPEPTEETVSQNTPVVEQASQEPQNSPVAEKTPEVPQESPAFSKEEREELDNANINNGTNRQEQISSKDNVPKPALQLKDIFLGDATGTKTNKQNSKPSKIHDAQKFLKAILDISGRKTLGEFMENHPMGYDAHFLTTELKNIDHYKRNASTYLGITEAQADNLAFYAYYVLRDYIERGTPEQKAKAIETLGFDPIARWKGEKESKSEEKKQISLPNVSSSGSQSSPNELDKASESVSASTNEVPSTPNPSNTLFDTTGGETSQEVVTEQQPKPEANPKVKRGPKPKPAQATNQKSLLPQETENVPPKQAEQKPVEETKTKPKSKRGRKLKATAQIDWREDAKQQLASFDIDKAMEGWEEADTRDFRQEALNEAINAVKWSVENDDVSSYRVAQKTLNGILKEKSPKEKESNKHEDDVDSLARGLNSEIEDDQDENRYLSTKELETLSETEALEHEAKSKEPRKINQKPFEELTDNNKLIRTIQTSTPASPEYNEAYNQLTKKINSRVVNALTESGIPEEDAKDAVQKTWTRILESNSLQKFNTDGKDDGIIGYLFSSAVKKHIDVKKAAKNNMASTNEVTQSVKGDKEVTLADTIEDRDHKKSLDSEEADRVRQETNNFIERAKGKLAKDDDFAFSDATINVLENMSIDDLASIMLLEDNGTAKNKKEESEESKIRKGAGIEDTNISEWARRIYGKNKGEELTVSERTNAKKILLKIKDLAYKDWDFISTLGAVLRNSLHYAKLRKKILISEDNVVKYTKEEDDYQSLLQELKSECEPKQSKSLFGNVLELKYIV